MDIKQNSVIYVFYKYEVRHNSSWENFHNK